MHAEEVIIGSGTQTTSILPTNTQIGNLTQQIFTADEVNHAAGVINAISFYVEQGYSTSRQMTFFMNNSSATSFSDHSIPVSGSKVFTGYWDIPATAGWCTLVFDDYFQYDGTSNILITFNDYGTNETWTPRSFRVYSSTNNCAISAESDGFFLYASQENDGTAVSIKNQVKLHFVDATTIVSNPSPIEMGERPLGAWMRPIPFTLTNTGDATTITGMSIADTYFILNDVEVPYTLGLEESRDFSITTGTTTPGEKTDNIVLTFEGGTAEVPVSATAYTPVTPDVWELPREVTFDGNTYTDTPDYEELRDNYLLPGNTTDGKDAVYKLVFDEDVLLSASVTGTNGKVALYNEGFGGVGGPSTDNNFDGPVANTGCPTSFYFDWESGGLEGWTTIDADGDGYNWENRNGYLASDSYDHVGWQALTPDNFVVSPEKYTITAYSELIYNIGCTSDEFLEHYGIFVSFTGNTNPDDFELVTDEWIDNYGFEEKTLSLEPYAGRDVYIAFRHYDVTDAYTVVLDDARLVSGRGTTDSNSSFTNMTVPAGTYYLAASATTEFTVNIEKAAIPVPVAASNPFPAMNAIDIESNLNLRWELGQYTTEYQLKIGTSNPPQDILNDWTSDLDELFAVFNLYSDTKYYWQVNERNSTGVTEGPVWEFTTPLVVPVLTVTNAYLYPDESTTLQWTINYKNGRATISKYNVYKDGQLYGETTEESYLVEGLTYTNYGYKFTVTAVYEEGESHHSNEVTVKMTGHGNISGTVFDTDGTTPMANANVKVFGVDEHGYESIYDFTTNANGQFAGEMLAGRYRAYASVDGYRDSYNDGPIVVNYQANTSGVKIVMQQQVQSVANVVAEAINSYAVKVTWDAANDPNHDVQYYNVYRKHGGTTELLATNITETEYIDGEWNPGNNGEYQWGVECVYEGGFSPNMAYAYAYYGNGFPDGYMYYDIRKPMETANFLSNEHIFYAGDIASDGYLYTTYADLALGICQTLYLYKIDIKTGAILSEKDIFDSNSELITDMAYDISTDKMFCTDAKGNLRVLNLTTGAQTVIGSLGMYAMVLMTTYDGRLYTINMEGEIYEVNKNNASTKYIASTGKESPYLQTAYVSRVTNKTYWHYCGGDMGLEFYELNLATGETKAICQTGQHDVFILPCIMPAPESETAWSNTIDDVTETELSGINIYPNPTRGELHIQADGLRHVSVCNTQGQVVFEAEMQAGTTTLNMSQFESGLYMVSVVTDSGISTKRVAVLH